MSCVWYQKELCSLAYLKDAEQNIVRYTPANQVARDEDVEWYIEEVENS